MEKFKLIDTAGVLREAGVEDSEEKEYRTKEFAFIDGPRGFILTDNEAIHMVREPDGEVKLPVWVTEKVGDRKTFGIEPAGTISLDRDGLLRFVRTDAEVDLKTWVHYFGIKARIQGNYASLEASCKEIGVKVDFPDWKTG